MTVGNCGDIPANCTAPPLTATGNYYMIVNKATGNVLATSGTGADATIEQQAPAAPSNGDWMVPANKGQLWQIFPAEITGPATTTMTSVDSSANPSVFGHLTLTSTIAGGTPLAGSTVTFKDVATILGTVTLTGGQTTASLRHIDPTGRIALDNRRVQR